MTNKKIVIIIVVVIAIVIIVMIQQHELYVKNRGKMFNLSRAKVEDSLLNVRPERVTKYGVEIYGQEYPVLQILAAATGTPKIEWSTVNTYRILQKLGFEIRIHE
ncbi:hypothetical protein ACFLTR_00820 [Chloroflexota bacterium]